MEAVSGVFKSRADAERAAAQARSAEVPPNKVTVLIPGTNEQIEKEIESIPVVGGEQPGMGKVIGGMIGGAAGVSAGPLLVALIPGVGPITAVGMLGAAIVGAAGAGAGAAAGAKVETSMTEGLPQDEIFVYEDALRKGRSVVVALADGAAQAMLLRRLFNAEGAEAVDAAREEWWIGLRSSEEEHYAGSGRNFSEDEKFFRMGFEAALHARNRCKEFDQVLSEMSAKLEDLQREYPNAKVEGPFTNGYQRGREYYQSLCDEKKAA